ncbi:glycoside hydrolase family 88 protein [Lapidilactobacillus bayanensis]|uniref:glycoside hydrolase family 88 protein n=1 Tax=Lapidilactobacillus bayanensis TaxID=2485998 RepID=UPI000F778DBD|nr:glycoside hydrolase family 88 protein [Lapidilactobacillus bayanensis]
MQTELINQGQKVDDAWLTKMLNQCVGKLRKALPKFQNAFPSACTTNMKYRIKGNDDWTNGFWTAMMWQAYQITNDSEFKVQAEEQLVSFKQRLADNFILNHHDIGFLYSLSAYAGYQITGSTTDQAMVVAAADVLVGRFQKKGQFIQAWGDLDNPDEYRLIIDSLLNLPLLFEAAKISGDSRYATIGQQHYQQVLDYIVRPDFSTYHTFYFDPQTGQPLKGATRQGYSDNSCWARGQAWILLGMPLYRRFFQETNQRERYQELLNYYLQHLPADGVPYWDLIFTEEDQQPRDSSAAAIAACGMIEAQKQGYLANGQELARGIIYRLGESYLTGADQEGLLQHGVYAYADNKGVDEANLWGDYFFMEALMRLKYHDWQTYW